MTVEYKVVIEKIGIAFLLTIVAYFAAYIFEVSYLRSYGISWQAARVIISSLVVSFCDDNVVEYIPKTFYGPTF